jgi:hypothetical protein
VSLAGIPPLLNPPTGIFGALATAGTVVNTLTLLRADAALVSEVLIPGAPQWGIFDLNGDPLAVTDSFVSLHYKQEWRLPNYPQEQGAFQTYNKVQLPFDAIVKLSKGGSAIARQEFLAAIDAAAQSLQLYTVITPERIFPNVNIARYDYERTADAGRGLITVEIGLIEIRASATAAFTDTKASSGVNPLSQGNLNAVPATTQQSAALPLTQ